MSVYNVNFSQVWKLLTPPILRQKKSQAWGDVLLKPLQYFRNNVLGDYSTGSTYSMFDNSSAYTKGDRVVYVDRGVYENLTGSTGALPIDIYSWYKINDNYLGIDERVQYKSQVMTFEYALNRHFQTTGIYIVTTPAPPNVLYMGQTSATSTKISKYTYGQVTAAYISQYPIDSNSYNYVIHVPNSKLTSLASTFSGQTNIIRSFADTLNLAGMKYSVSGY